MTITSVIKGGSSTTCGKLQPQQVINLDLNTGYHY